MNNENKIGYYAIIPSTVLFNEKLKANEKLLYATITVLSNKEGYCFASNAYLGRLLNAQPHTINKTEGIFPKGQYNNISINNINKNNTNI